MIEVRRVGDHDPLEFKVVVRDEKGESRHDVTMARKTHEKLTAGKHTPERCLALRCDRDSALLPRI